MFFSLRKVMVGVLQYAYAPARDKFLDSFIAFRFSIPPGKLHFCLTGKTKRLFSWSDITDLTVNM